MHERTQALITRLALEPHPEGGFFREVHRSGLTVTRHSDNATRTAGTSIYFLLPGGICSRWHRVASDEVWHYYEGSNLELFIAFDPNPETQPVLLGPVSDHSCPVQVVPAGWWQMARTTGDYTLVGCSVSPGFEFGDFELI